MLDLTTIAGFASLGLSAAAGYGLFQHLKSKLDAVRQLIDDVDNDVAKGTIATADLQKVWADIKAVVS